MGWSICPDPGNVDNANGHEKLDPMVPLERRKFIGLLLTCTNLKARHERG